MALNEGAAKYLLKLYRELYARLKVYENERRADEVDAYGLLVSTLWETLSRAGLEAELSTIEAQVDVAVGRDDQAEAGFKRSGAN